jgi:phosphomannomutase
MHNIMIDIAKFFKAYDLRGTTPELDWKVYYLAGKALVTEVMIKEGLELSINVWSDARLTSPLFYKALINGLESEGCQVIPCGIGSTDMMYAYTISKNISGAIVTASHNPKDDNGLKVVKKYPEMLGLAGGLDKVRDYVVANYEALEITEKDLKSVSNNIEAKLEAIEYMTKVSNIIGDFVNIKTPDNYSIVVDAGNGMGSLIYELLKTQYPKIKFIPLYCELDGNFPNHPADPINPENLVDLQNAVKVNKANLGIAFDGDADRAFFVDENAELINGENLVAVFAKQLVSNSINKPELGYNPASVYVVSYSRALADTVLMAGGGAIVSKQGHTFVKANMKKYNAIYGGEASGHHYFGQFGFMDSGILAVNLILNIMFTNNQKASELCSYYEDKYFTSGEHNLKAPVGKDMKLVIERVKRKYTDAVISELDGITVYYPEWKMTIRGSNTEPLFRINVETKVNTGILNPQLKLEEAKKLILD